MAFIEKDEKQNEKLRAWNPMREDYSNSNFNHYISGPGADLDPDFQQLSNQSKKQNLSQKNDQNRNSKGSAPVPYLVFKNVPKEMTTHALGNICSRHGRVEHVRDSTKNDYFFVDLASVADMEAVYRGLENNSYGFHIIVGKEFRKDKPQLAPPVSNIPNDDELPMVESARKNTIDMENRKYQASAKQHPRPHIKQKSIVSAESYASKNSLLQRNDPQRHFLFEDDAHTLERANLVRPEANSQQQSKYKYNTGRAYIDMPKKTQAFITDKNTKSAGTFDASTIKYTIKNDAAKQHALNSDKCVECGHPCDIVCARCGTFYCGLECQIKAWPKHRFICGKPENLKISVLDSAEKVETQGTEAASTPQETATKSGNEAKMPRSGNIVIITAISKTNIVFIRSKTYEDNMHFFKTISAIQNEAKYFCKLQSAPIAGQIVVTCFQGSFNRAMVLNADDLNSIKLVYIDFGNIDNKKLADLYEAPEDYVNMPRLAIPVILKDVPNVYMTEKVRQFMYSYLDGIDMQVKYKADEDFIAEKGVHCVELIDEATNQNFNKAVATLCKYVEPKEPSEVYFRDYLQVQLPPGGTNTELVVMDNSLFCTGCISCTTLECAIEIQKFQVELQRYGESLKEQNYAPRVDELCIARYNADGKWYRGRCLDLVGDGFPTIAFIDYGNIALVSIKDIRRYSPQFTYPVYTVDCEIEGLPECCDERVVAKLEELIPNGSTVCCEHIEIYKDDNFLRIKLPKVIEDLKIAGLLE